jgi:hypothetical protein
MADVSITIRKSGVGGDTTIIVSGIVDDAALQPFTNQLSTLLSATANSASSTPPA